MSRRGAAACLYPCYRIAPALTLRQAHVPPEQQPGQSARSRVRLSGLPRRHGGSNFDLSRYGGSHHGDGGPTELERSHRAGSNYEGCTGRSQALPLRLHPHACCLSPSCQIVHRWPWAASHEAAAVHLPKRNSLASATRDLTHAARLTLQAAGSQWEAVLIHASTPCFNARSVACLMRLSVLCSKRKQAVHAIDCHRSNITSPALSVSRQHQMYKTAEPRGLAALQGRVTARLA